jgi:hypothetical protein
VFEPIIPTIDKPATFVDLIDPYNVGVCRLRRPTFLLVCAAVFCSVPACAQVAVRHAEGLVHGFLVLRSLEGEILADGDLLQNAQGDRVTSRLVFHFKDGSLHDETVVFSQRKTVRLISDHLIQKGPAFPHPIEVTLNARNGEVKVHYTEDGKEKDLDEHMKLPPDVSNGLMLTLLKAMNPATPETKVSMVAATPKPELVKLAVKRQGEDTFTTGNERRKAMHFLVKIEIGGIKGALASLLGKEPPDTQVWIVEGEAPAFVKSEGPLAFGAPVWRIELVSPVFPKKEETPEKKEK